MENKKNHRIFIWSAPRSVSTALQRSFSNLGKSKVFFEPTLQAFYRGSDRMSSRQVSSEILPNCSFADIKAKLEKPYEDYDYVIAKDMSYHYITRTHSIDVIPDGYSHIFLIRHPAKTISARWDILNTDSEKAVVFGIDYRGFQAEDASYKEIPELFQLVHRKTGKEPIVVEAEDLLEKPEEMLKKLCSLIGVPYNDSLMNWKPLDEEQEEITNEFIVWMENVRTTTGLIPKQRRPPPDISVYPDFIQKAVADALPYYNEMYEKRLIL